MKKIVNFFRKVNKYLAFVEQERINAMVYCGRGWG
jgi:hypothetical protein